MVGPAKGAQSGVLFRNAEALERLQSVRAIVLDKTGTLTEGKPRVTDFVVAAGTDRPLTLAQIAAAERGSEHPLGEAIVRYARDDLALALPEAERFESVAGAGVTADVAGTRVSVGRSEFVHAEEPPPQELLNAADRFAQDGKTAVFAAIDGRVVATLAIADSLKP